MTQFWGTVLVYAFKKNAYAYDLFLSSSNKITCP